MRAVLVLACIGHRKCRGSLHAPPNKSLQRTRPRASRPAGPLNSSRYASLPSSLARRGAHGHTGTLARSSSIPGRAVLSPLVVVAALPVQSILGPSRFAAATASSASYRSPSLAVETPSPRARSAHSNSLRFLWSAVPRTESFRSRASRSFPGARPSRSAPAIVATRLLHEGRCCNA